jgi:hypothetical protein
MLIHFFKVYYGDFYTFNCSIGTPPQEITIAINLGLGDTIINNSTLEVWANGKDEQKAFCTGNTILQSQ